MLKNFITYGLLGWCLEIVFTSITSLRNRDARLMGQTSLWMFFIYGSAAFFFPLFEFFSEIPIFLRGVIYTFCIFFVEFAAGSALKLAGVCPWDYSNAKYNLRGVIRADFAPLWFGAGLFFEYVYRHFL